MATTEPPPQAPLPRYLLAIIFRFDAFMLIMCINFLCPMVSVVIFAVIRVYKTQTSIQHHVIAETC